MVKKGQGVKLPWPSKIDKTALLYDLYVPYIYKSIKTLKLV